MIPLSLADLRLAARLLSEAAAALSRAADTLREADKARQMRKLSNKLLKKIEQCTQKTTSPTGTSQREASESNNNQ